MKRILIGLILGIIATAVFMNYSFILISRKQYNEGVKSVKQGIVQRYMPILIEGEKK